MDTAKIESKNEPEIRAAKPSDLEGLIHCYVKMYEELKGFGFPFELNMEQLKDVLKTYIESKLMCTLILWDQEMQQVEGFITAGISKLDRQFQRSVRFHATDEVAPENKRIVATSPLLDPLIGNIKDLYVSERFRKMNLATRLYEQAEAWFTNKNISLIQLNVFPGNLKAEGFWAKHGFLPMTTQLYKNLIQK